jgi:hypothetical protein
MKPEAGKKTSRSPLPASPAPAPAPAPQRVAELSDEQFMEFIYPDREFTPEEAAGTLRELSLIRELNPGIQPVLEQLLSTGSDTAHFLIRKDVDNSVQSLIRSRAVYGDRSTWGTTASSTCERLTPLELRQTWNCGNVMEESGQDHRRSVIPGRVENVIQKELKLYNPRLDPEKASDQYWRGVTAFTITDVLLDPKVPLSKDEKAAAQKAFNRDARDFIAYAGKHKDVGLVIRTSIERNTVNVADIKHFINVTKDAPMLRDGAL